MSKYEILCDHLRSMTEPVWRARFADVEAVLGFSLPRSAYSYPAWWSNDATGHSHSLAWLEAGWKTEQVDIAAQQVTFRRAKDAQPAQTKGKASRLGSGETLHGAIPGVIQMVSGTDLTKPTGAAGPVRKSTS